MANKRLEMLDVKHLIRLKNQSRSNREIAKLLNLHRNTVNEYVNKLKRLEQSYEHLLKLDDATLTALLHPPVAQESERQADLSKLLPSLAVAYKQVGSTYQALWKDYQQLYPLGYSYTQFKKHLKSYLGRSGVSLHWEHKFGDKLFVDFTGKKLAVVDKVSGEVSWKEVLVACLGGSQYTYVEALDSQGLDDFLAAIQNALHFMKGVPRAIVPDNLKSAVHKADKYEPQVNRNFKAMGLHYQTTILPTRSRKPKDKALVEGAVKIVYQRIFYPVGKNTYYTLADLNAAIRYHLDLYNQVTFQGQTYSRKELFDREEAHLLESLPSVRYQRCYYREGRVNKDAHVYLEGHYYSVPYQYAGTPGSRIFVQYTRQTVEVFLSATHERLAVHQRATKKGGYSTKKEHLPPNIRFVKDWSLEKFTKQALQIGSACQAYFAAIYEHKTHPEQAHKACMGILSLQKHYEKARIEAACQRANFFQAYSYRYIKNILEQGLDRVAYQPHATTDQAPTLDQAHPNIRGGEYYE